MIKKQEINYYDVMIIGAGPGGLFAAYELSKLSNLSILIADKGKSLDERVNFCKPHKCSPRDPCGITHGIGGAGLFSDGKFRPFFNLEKYSIDLLGSKRLGEEIVTHIKEISSKLKIDIRCKNPDLKKIRSMEKNASSVGMKFTYYPGVIHIGSDASILPIKKIVTNLESAGVMFLVNSKAGNIKISNELINIELIMNNKKITISTRFLALAPGKAGARWMNEQIKRLKIKTEKTPPFVGIRVEVDRNIMKPLTNLSYDPKISMYTESNDYVKTHCFCEGGRVIDCRYDDLRVLGGHSLMDPDSKNTNFAILSSINLPKATDPYEYSERLVRSVNKLGNGKLLIQRLGDLISGKKSTLKDIKNNMISSTLLAYTPADIRRALPQRVIKNILLFLEKLDAICPGIMNESTLVYAPAVEWWSNRIVVNSNMETSVKNIFAVGEGAGSSKGIVGSAATGVLAARRIIKKIMNIEKSE